MTFFKKGFAANFFRQDFYLNMVFDLKEVDQVTQFQGKFLLSQCFPVFGILRRSTFSKIFVGFKTANLPEKDSFKEYCRTFERIANKENAILKWRKTLKSITFWC